jgi:hypothetical protein
MESARGPEPEPESYPILNDKLYEIVGDNYVIMTNIAPAQGIRLARSILYIRKDIFSEIKRSPFKILLKNNIITGKSDIIIYDQKYYRFVFYKQLRDERTLSIPHYINERDCLKFAEALDMATKIPYTRKERPYKVKLRIREMVETHLISSKPPQFVELNTRRLFGMTIKENQSIVGTILQRIRKDGFNENINENAFPEPGQAYAFVQTNRVDGSHPYHIEYVLFRYHGITVTLETRADSKGVARYPTFSFYSNEHTFHEALYNSYFETDFRTDFAKRIIKGITIILTPKPSSGGKSNKTHKKRKKNRRTQKNGISH